MPNKNRKIYDAERAVISEKLYHQVLMVRQNWIQGYHSRGEIKESYLTHSEDPKVIAVRANLRARQSLEVTVGIPPFGIIRTDTGGLIKAYNGVWILADGAWLTADFRDESNKPPHAVLWRGYGDAMLQTLNLYATGQYSYRRLAETLNGEDWLFKGHSGPQRFTASSAWQVVANIYTYGGILQNAKQES